ncbi:hypothetical protein [Mycobacterium sp. ACS4331]|uniref:hypothetical protein n=1 Tax=Mycobacterium sp. ACS4331 TaxID=1834121 RepID=UPI0008023CC8|nr:hypothetical protein [Mycobacterium sp. ACS4331]OBF21196.1 hypothetical protein A5727_00830 [Mycobacterium sp. ACS4331]
MISNLFDAPLPRGLREQTAGMSWDAVLTTFAACSGPVRLGGWERAAAGEFKATLSIGDRVCTATASAVGPIGALTAMLYEHGVAFETLEFHQLHAGENTATFVRGGNGAAEEWALGWSADATQSALTAILACANRLGV